MHYRAISYINLPKTYDEAILAQFVVHHATDSNRTIKIECLRCHHTCQILKCWFAVGILPADSWPTVYRQTFWGDVLHFYPFLFHTTKLYSMTSMLEFLLAHRRAIKAARFRGIIEHNRDLWHQVFQRKLQTANRKMSSDHVLAATFAVCHLRFNVKTIFPQ